MKNKVRWGVMGSAKIALKKVIPSMSYCKYAVVEAIASRNEELAISAAEDLEIPKAYGSYEDLLNDKDIDAIYIPLPNHLHLEWTMKCIEAGKHVLCEKPFVLNHKDVSKLIQLRNRSKLKIGEAFMVRSHPRWTAIKEIIDKGVIGEMNLIRGFFSYYNDDAQNIRNQYSEGGGGIWDIGCYPVQISRYLFGKNPKRVSASLIYDSKYKVDILGSVILEFENGLCSFSVGTQLARYQSVQIFGRNKWIDVEMPFNPPIIESSEIQIVSEEDPAAPRQIITIPPADQFTLQADAFSKAILDNKDEPVTLEDTLGNTLTIEAIFKAAKTGMWVNVGKS